MLFSDLPANLQRHINATDSCWLWTASLRHNGYGQYVFEGKNWAAHRLIYTLMLEPVPSNMDLDHLCRVRKCVNPFHLEVVTRRENLLRGKTITARNAAVTECPQGHVYDGENTIITRRGTRVCRTCKRVKDLAAYHTKKGVTCT